MIVDFLIPRRPLSAQAKNRANLQRWKSFVHEEARKAWKKPTMQGRDFHIKLIYLCDKDPVDTDNIIKPIQDALVGIIYDDDTDVTDVECHRRPISGTSDITDFPFLLLEGLNRCDECVYVQVIAAGPLEVYL